MVTRMTTDERLSSRERAVLACLCEGMANKEIAMALGISPRTVQKHLQRVYQHLGAQTRTEAIVRIHQNRKSVTF